MTPVDLIVLVADPSSPTTTALTVLHKDGSTEALDSSDLPEGTTIFDASDDQNVIYTINDLGYPTNGTTAVPGVYTSTADGLAEVVADEAGCTGVTRLVYEQSQSVPVGGAIPALLQVQRNVSEDTAVTGSDGLLLVTADCDVAFPVDGSIADGKMVAVSSLEATATITCDNGFAALDGGEVADEIPIPGGDLVMLMKVSGVWQIILHTPVTSSGGGFTEVDAMTLDVTDPTRVQVVTNADGELLVDVDSFDAGTTFLNADGIGYTTDGAGGLTVGDRFHDGFYVSTGNSDLPTAGAILAIIKNGVVRIYGGDLVALSVEVASLVDQLDVALPHVRNVVDGDSLQAGDANGVIAFDAFVAGGIITGDYHVIPDGAWVIVVRTDPNASNDVTLTGFISSLDITLGAVSLPAGTTDAASATAAGTVSSIRFVRVGSGLRIF